MDMPTSITQKVYLLAEAAAYEECGYHFRISPYENPDCMVLGEAVVSMDVPENYDFVSGRIDLLKAEKDRLNAETHLKTTNIDEQIQRLLVIEHKSDEK